MPLFVILPAFVTAQDENAAIREGNKQYKKGQFDQALSVYQKAVAQNPKNSIARYNLANARYRTGNLPEAEKSFGELIENTPEKTYKEKGYYNKGVTLTKQKNFEDTGYDQIKPRSENCGSEQQPGGSNIHARLLRQ